MNTLRYLSYCRKSTKRSDRQVQSIQDQQDEINELIEKKTLNLVGEFQDEMSAKEPNRPGFNALVEALEKGGADGLICWKLNRLARNPVDNGTIKWLLQKGVIKEIVTPFKTYRSEDNVIAIGVEFDMGTQDLIDLSRGVKRGQRGKIKQGFHPGKAPTGYVNDPHGIKGSKQIFRDPEVFPALQHLWQQILERDYQLQELYNYMQAKCPIYRQGKLIPFNTFCAIFRNPFYYGLFKWAGEYHLGKHEPMITKDEFDRVQRILGENTDVRFYGQEFPYKGLIRCGGCGGSITGEKHTRVNKGDQRKRIYHYYRCPRKQSECSQKPVSEKRLEQEILQLVSSIQFPKEFIQFMELQIKREQEQQQQGLGTSLSQVQHQKALKALRKRMTDLEDLLTEEKSEKVRKLMVRKLEKLELEANGLEKSIKKETALQRQPFQAIREGLGCSETLSNKFEMLSFVEKRDLLKRVILNWRLMNGKLEGDYVFEVQVLQKTHQFHQRVKPRFELMQTLTASDVSTKNMEITSVWSYFLKLIRHMQDC